MRQIHSRNIFEFLAGTALIYSLECIFLTLILGSISILHPIAAIIFSGLWAATIFYFFRQRGYRPVMPQLTQTEIVVTIAAGGFIFINAGLNLLLPPPGTDSLLYHLYYPASWLNAGHLFRIPIISLFTDYYPIYGELFYAWMMMPFYNDFMAKNLQYASLLFASITIVAGGSAMGLPRRSAIYAAALMVFTGIIFRNANVANTDLLTGYLLLAGIVFFMLGLRHCSLNHLLLAGLALGVCAGTKYLGLMLTPIAMIMLLTIGLLSKQPCRRYFPAFIAATILAASPYYLANWLIAGNPFYPVGIKIGGLTLFQSGPSTASAPIGLRWAAWNFFVNGNVEAMNRETAVIYILLPAIVLLTFIGQSSTRLHITGRLIVVPLAVLVVVNTIILMIFFPVDGQPRQIIPVLMIAALLFIPLFSRLEQIGRRIRLPVIALFLLLAIALSYRQNHPEAWLYLSVLTVGGSLFCVYFHRLQPRLQKLIAVAAILVLLWSAGDRIFQSSVLKYQLYHAMLTPEDAQAFAIIDKMTWDQPATIAMVGPFGYGFMGKQYRNRVIYIPITISGRRFCHEYATLKEMRQPAEFAVWLDRLRREKIGFLVCDARFLSLNSQSTVPIEAYWAFRHPTWFRPIMAINRLYIFQVNIPQ